MSPRNSGAVYIISIAAELAGVHPQTLRTYERKGLLKPARTAGGTRRYSARDVERVRRARLDSERLRREASLALAEAVRRSGTELVLYRRNEIERHRG